MRVCIFGDAQSVHLRQLLPGLVGRGLRVHVVTRRLGELPGATVERFVVPPLSLTNVRRWRSRRRAYLHGFLRRFDVVNIHFLADWGFGTEDGIEPGEIERACVVASPWGSDIIDPPGENAASCGLRRSRVLLLRRAAAISSCGPTFARAVAAYAGLETDQVRVVPFGVDLNRFHPASRSAAAPPLVGFFKGFREVYGPEHLIRAIPAVLARIPHARFELVGDGPMLSQCRRLAEELAVGGSISWVPRQRHVDLPRVLSRWAVSVIPSIHEAFGVAALESSAMGLPVVASDVCGLRDTVCDGRTGLLVPPGDSPALAEALVRLLRDRDLRFRLGAQGRRMVEREFNWEDLFPQWIGVYETARQRRCMLV